MRRECRERFRFRTITQVKPTGNESKVFIGEAYMSVFAYTFDNKSTSLPDNYYHSHSMGPLSIMMTWALIQYEDGILPV